MGRTPPYDSAAFDAVAKELREGPPLKYGEPDTRERIARAVVRAQQASLGDCRATLLAHRLNKHGVPNEWGRPGQWCWAYVQLALEHATALEREKVRALQPPRLQRTPEELRRIAEEAEARDAPLDPVWSGEPVESLTIYQENERARRMRWR
jgi:hypothetical protein